MDRNAILAIAGHSSDDIGQPDLRLEPSDLKGNGKRLDAISAHTTVGAYWLGQSRVNPVPIVKGRRYLAAPRYITAFGYDAVRDGLIVSDGRSRK